MKEEAVKVIETSSEESSWRMFNDDIFSWFFNASNCLSLLFSFLLSPLRTRRRVYFLWPKETLRRRLFAAECHFNRKTKRFYLQKILNELKMYFFSDLDVCRAISVFSLSVVSGRSPSSRHKEILDANWKVICWLSQIGFVRNLSWFFTSFAFRFQRKTTKLLRFA